MRHFAFAAVSVAFSLLLLSGLTAYAQEYPEVGKKCPDVVLQNIKYWDKDHASIKDFRGKWLMLDFFNRFCGACVASFPHVDSIRKEYKDKMEVMMVGVYRSDGPGEKDNVEAMYEKHRKEKNLTMPVAFDSVLGMKWDIYTAPYVIFIDDKGIVRGITYRSRRNEIDSMMAGLQPHLPKVHRVHEDDWPILKPNKNEFAYDSEMPEDSYKGPRFAIKNDAPFPMTVMFDNPRTEDSLGAGQTSKFYQGDYRLALQITNIYFNMQYGDYRGKTCAFRYKPAAIKEPLPMGDWIIHFYYDKGWKFKAARIKY